MLTIYRLQVWNTKTEEVKNIRVSSDSVGSLDERKQKLEKYLKSLNLNVDKYLDIKEVK